MSFKRKPIINTHCHFFNLKFIPGEMVELLSHITEDMAKEEWFGVSAGILFELTPGKEYKRITRFLRTFRLPIERVVKEYIKRMDEAGIDICVPLLIDFEQAVPDTKTPDTDIPYYKKRKESQIALISEQAAKYPWRIFPFVMFDPRRKNAVEICVEAIEKYGYIGIKLYPALGYHPEPAINYTPGPYWERFIIKSKKSAQRLDSLYQYCSDNEIPIITHADVDGAYTSERFSKTPWYVNNLIKIIELDKIREKEVWPLTEIYNWMLPIQEYNLKINFAHLGGNYFHNSKVMRKKAARWRRQILNFISVSINKNNSFGKIYSDLSYHYMALEERYQKQYFRDLQDILFQEDYQSRILFGTDASLLSHTWKEIDYITPFKNEDFLAKPLQEKILSDNPTEFLFNNAKIPNTYINFLKQNASPDAFLNLPDWVIKKENNFYIVTNNDLQ
ncbi:MAG: amidohydrolase family protein [Cyanobacteriota bacterium]